MLSNTPIKIGAVVATSGARQTAPDSYFVKGFNPALDLLGAQLRHAGITDLASVMAFITEQSDLFEGGWYTDSYVGPELSERLRRRYSSERLATHTVPATDAVGCAEGLSRTALMPDS